MWSVQLPVQGRCHAGQRRQLEGQPDACRVAGGRRGETLPCSTKNEHVIGIGLKKPNAYKTTHPQKSDRTIQNYSTETGEQVCEAMPSHTAHSQYHSMCEPTSLLLEAPALGFGHIDDINHFLVCVLPTNVLFAEL